MDKLVKEPAYSFYGIVGKFCC